MQGSLLLQLRAVPLLKALPAHVLHGGSDHRCNCCYLSSYLFSVCASRQGVSYTSVRLTAVLSWFSHLPAGSLATAGVP